MDKWLKTYNANALRDCLRQEFISLIKEGKLSPNGLTDDAVSWCVQWAYNHMDNYSRDPVQDVAVIASRAYLNENTHSGEEKSSTQKRPRQKPGPRGGSRFFRDLDDVISKLAAVIKDFNTEGRNYNQKAICMVLMERVGAETGDPERSLRDQVGRHFEVSLDWVIGEAKKRAKEGAISAK